MTRQLWGISSAGSPVGIKTHPQSDSPATINSQQKTPSKRFASWILWGISSAGRALAWHARGHRFDPGNLHQKEKHCTGMCGAFLLCLPSYAAAKFMLDICGKLWYNSFCNCGYSTSASISAFQAEEVGSIPIARSTKTA